MAKQDLLELREGRPLALRQQTALTLQLSFPVILAQISSIVMQYIDAAMAGQLGRDASAAIGLVASALMYALAPWIIGMLSPDRQVVLLGTQVLRIVVFSEPLFGASIVTAGVFQGAGSSLLSSVLNFVGMWGVRITLTLLMVPRWGLRGAWIAMCIELCFRGSLFLFFLWRKRWLPRELA